MRNPGRRSAVLSGMPATLRAAALLVPAFMVSACVVSIDREGYIEREEKRFPAPSVAEVHLITFDGSMDIRSWDQPEVTVEVEKRGRDKDAVSRIEVLASQKGNRIDFEARGHQPLRPRSVRVDLGPIHRHRATPDQSRRADR
jgi:hypothetical protein